MTIVMTSMSTIVIGPFPSTTTVFVMFAFETRMVEPSSAKISPMFSFKGGTVMFVIEAITVMAVPGRIGIISVSGIFPFIYYGCSDTNVHMHLGGSRIHCQAPGYDHR